MARGLTHIRRGTASTLEQVYHTGSQVFGNFILEGKKGRDSSGKTKNESNVNEEKQRCRVG